MAGRAQRAIVDFLSQNDEKTATIVVSEFARSLNVGFGSVNAALHSLLNNGVIKKSDELCAAMSTKYVLIGDFPATAQRQTMPRRPNHKLGGDLLERAMEQVATLKATQDRLIEALAKIKELEKVVLERDKTIFLKDKEITDLKDELNATDAQLAGEQSKFLELLQSTERNNKMLTRKIAFDGQGVQRTADA